MKELLKHGLTRERESWTPFSTLLILFLYTFSNIYPIEENDLQPFFSLESDKVNIHLNKQDVKFCKIKNKDYLSLNNFIVVDCYPLEETFFQIWKNIQTKEDQSKENSFVFMDSNKTIVPVEMEINQNSFRFMDFVYNKRDRILYVEIFDKKDRYFFYIVDPKNITIHPVKK